MAEEQVQEEETEVGVLSMSDEDLLNMSPQEFLAAHQKNEDEKEEPCLLYTSPSPRD